MDEMKYSAPQGRVLMLITTLTFGGAETQVVRLATELKSRNWDVAIACMIAPSQHVEALNRHGIPTYSLGMSRGVPDPRALIRLARLIRDFSPDVVHSHMVHANLLARFTRLICPMRVLVCTAHNLRETSEKGGPTWHKELLYRATDFLADQTTIICDAAYELYIPTKATPANKLRMIPNGVDTDRFAPSEATRQRVRKELNLGESFTWLAVGRLVEQKDYPNLLSAVAQLPEGDWRVLVAGSGPLEESLKARVAELALTDRVQFIGTRANVESLLNACDGYVMSSRFEGLSMALLEASSSGLPAVVTDVGGNRDLVNDGETGYVVQPANPVALADAMTRLMELPYAERRQIGIAARRRCLDRYRFEAVGEEWIRLYRQFMSVTTARQTRPAISTNCALNKDSAR
jgi:glycosyltransferase involved in cell wall biosynthesis